MAALLQGIACAAQPLADAQPMVGPIGAVPITIAPIVVGPIRAEPIGAGPITTGPIVAAIHRLADYSWLGQLG